MTTLILKIDAAAKAKLSSLARREGKTTSELVRELIDERIRERDIGAYIDDLWDRTGRKLKSKGVNQSAIEKAIKASRDKRG